MWQIHYVTESTGLWALTPLDYRPRDEKCELWIVGCLEEGFFHLGRMLPGYSVANLSVQSQQIKPRDSRLKYERENGKVKQYFLPSRDFQ